MIFLYSMMRNQQNERHLLFLINLDCTRHIQFPCLLSSYRSERQLDEVIIALVGKYTALEDAYASVLKALNHAALFCKRKLTIRVRIHVLPYLRSEDFCSVLVCSCIRFRSQYEKRRTGEIS